MVLRRPCATSRHLPTDETRRLWAGAGEMLLARDAHRDPRGPGHRALGGFLPAHLRGAVGSGAGMGAGVGTRLSDSEQYGHQWGTAELARVFEERARLQSWLDILTALAAAQARLGIIPAEAATEIAAHADASQLDLDFVAAETRRTLHSMLGLINGFQRLLPEEAREHVYV